jgi:hypothetical protein
MTLLERLSAPFPPAAVSWRVGATTQDKSKGMALAYIDARDVQDRLNEVCGHEWQVRHPWSTADGKVACEIGVKIDGEWIWRGDGAGNSDVEAEKGAFSDSFKRAAVRWGIGRYLYDIDSPWVELEQKGRSYVIAAREMARLRSGLMGKAQSNVEAPTRPTTAGSRSTPSGNPAGENAATRNATSAAPPHSRTPSSTGNGKHPKWDYAGARFREIEKAIKNADANTTPDDIWNSNTQDLDLIEELHPPSYQKLMALRDQMLAQLGLAGDSVGSSPALTGEP